MGLLLMVKLAIDVACGMLDSLGGFHWLFCRRYIMPAVIAVAVSYFSHVWWLGVLCLPSMGTLCIGYPSGSNWGRGLWLFIQAIALSLGCVLLGHLAWWIAVPYIVGAGFLGGIYKNWPQVVGDFLTGFYLSIFIFFIH
jgi:hypothetical protein